MKGDKKAYEQLVSEHHHPKRMNDMSPHYQAMIVNRRVPHKLIMSLQRSGSFVLAVFLVVGIDTVVRRKRPR